MTFKKETTSGATGSGRGIGANTTSVGSGGGNKSPEATRYPGTTKGAVEVTDTTISARTMTGKADGTAEAATAAVPTVVHTPVITKIIELCYFPQDSEMMSFIAMKGWWRLSDVTCIGLDDIKDLCVVDEDGKLVVKPSLTHSRMLMCFLMFYNRKCRNLSKSITEEDIMNMEKTDFHSYCGSDDYFADAATRDGVTGPTDSLTAQYYQSLKARHEELKKVSVSHDLSNESTSHRAYLSTGDGYATTRDAGRDGVRIYEPFKFLSEMTMQNADVFGYSNCFSGGIHTEEYKPYQDDTGDWKHMVDNTDKCCHLDDKVGKAKSQDILTEKNRSNQNLET